MRRQFLDKLVCPMDKKELSLKIHKQTIDEIMEGVLTCDHCGRYYPIVQGIAIMSPDEYREPTLERPLLERWGETRLIDDQASTAKPGIVIDRHGR